MSEKRKPGRGNLETIRDILLMSQQGCRSISSMMRASNISYVRLSKYTDVVTKLGLVQKKMHFVGDIKMYSFTLTSDGQTWLRALSDMTDKIESCMP